MFQKVDEHIFAQRFWCGKKCPTFVDLSELLDETAQSTSGVEHERVDTNVVASATHHLAQCGLDRGIGRWIVEEHLTIRADMSSGFPVSDHDDLLGATLASQHPTGQGKPVLHIGAINEVP